MNYLQARQIESGLHAGKWHYTSMNDGRIHAIGYCSIYKDCPTCDGRSFMTDNPCATCDKKGVVRKTDDEFCFHDTAEEANEHYKLYLLDDAKYDRKMSNQMLKCQICGEYTEKMASAGEWSTFILCDEHLNRESLEQLLHVGIAMTS